MWFSSYPYIVSGESKWFSGFQYITIGESKWFSAYTYDVDSVVNWYSSFPYAVTGGYIWFNNYPYSVTGVTDLNIVGVGYSATITGGEDSLDDYTFSMSNFQVFLYEERTSSITLTVPNSNDHLDDIEARTNGQIVINKYVILDDGTKSNEIEFIRFPFDTVDTHSSSRNNSMTITGAGVKTYRTGASIDIGSRYIKSTKSVDGVWNIDLPPDTNLVPGDSLAFDADTITLSSVQITVNSTINQQKAIGS